MGVTDSTQEGFGYWELIFNALSQLFVTEKEKEERKRKDKLREMARLLSQKIEQEKSELEEREDQNCEEAEENESQGGMYAQNSCSCFLY